MEQEDFALTVADAPSVAVNRVATYTELDNDLFKHAAFATLEEIDLRWHYLHIYISTLSTHLHIYTIYVSTCRVLTRCLETEAALREGDEPWHWETLFTETASEMQVRW